MISCIVRRNVTLAESRSALELAMSKIDAANLAGAGIRVASATPARRNHQWCLNLTTVTCSEPVQLAFGPGFIAVRKPNSRDVVDHVHLHVVTAQVVKAWEDAGLCSDIHDTSHYVEEGDWLALLNRSLKALGQPLTGWPFTPFMFSLDAS